MNLMPMLSKYFWWLRLEEVVKTTIGMVANCSFSFILLMVCLPSMRGIFMSIIIRQGHSMFFNHTYRKFKASTPFLASLIVRECPCDTTISFIKNRSSSSSSTQRITVVNGIVKSNDLANTSDTVLIPVKIRYLL